MLTHHADVADNLRAVRQQQKEFDKLYFAAMVSACSLPMSWGCLKCQSLLSC